MTDGRPPANAARYPGWRQMEARRSEVEMIVYKEVVHLREDIHM